MCIKAYALRHVLYSRREFYNPKKKKSKKRKKKKKKKKKKKEKKKEIKVQDLPEHSRWLQMALPFRSGPGKLAPLSPRSARLGAVAHRGLRGKGRLSACGRVHFPGSETSHYLVEYHGEVPGTFVSLYWFMGQFCRKLLYLLNGKI